MPHQQIIEDICSECTIPTGYCTLKEILLHSGISDRTLQQLKLVEMLKWDMSKEAKTDVGWQLAWESFIDRYAARYAEVYQEGMKARELYRLVRA